MVTSRWKLDDNWIKLILKSNFQATVWDAPKHGLLNDKIYFWPPQSVIATLYCASYHSTTWAKQEAVNRENPVVVTLTAENLSQSVNKMLACKLDKNNFIEAASDFCKLLNKWINSLTILTIIRHWRSSLRTEKNVKRASSQNSNESEDEVWKMIFSLIYLTLKAQNKFFY